RVAAGGGAIPPGHVVQRRNTRGFKVQTVQTGAAVGGQDPVHGQIGEVGQRVAQRRQLPVQHGADGHGVGRVDQVVDAIVAVDDGGARLFRRGARQEVDQALDLGQVVGLGGAVL